MTPDGYVYDSSGRKLRKPRLSSEEMIEEREAPAQEPDDGGTRSNGAPSFSAFSFLVASIVTMVAFKAEWPRKCGLSGEGGPLPPEYVAPAFGFMAALVVQQFASYGLVD